MTLQGLYPNSTAQVTEFYVGNGVTTVLFYVSIDGSGVFYVSCLLGAKNFIAVMY